MEGGLAKPLEFKLLEQAPLDAAGECAYLVRAIELMTERIVNLTISIGVCFLRDGRKISRVGDNRRGCMVALLQRKGRHPLVLIDVDHASLEGLSALVLRFHKMAELSTIEEAIQHQLSELVRYGHRWNPNAENLSPETYSAERLPRLMRTRGRPVTSSYVTIWAEELIDRLNAIEAPTSRSDICPRYTAPLQKRRNCLLKIERICGRIFRGLTRLCYKGISATKSIQSGMRSGRAGCPIPCQ
jgi:hypothetical protein